MRRGVANPQEYSHFTEHTWNLALYFLDNVEAEDAMARAGCETMEDDCAHGIRARLEWNGLQSPHTEGAEAYWADTYPDMIERHEVMIERRR